MGLQESLAGDLEALSSARWLCLVRRSLNSLKIPTEDGALLMEVFGAIPDDEGLSSVVGGPQSSSKTAILAREEVVSPHKLPETPSPIVSTVDSELLVSGKAFGRAGHDWRPEKPLLHRRLCL
jgi:hypothetical protein